MQDNVQVIKDRLSIVDVVGAYVKLTRAGRYFKGISPFTKEKTPSFFVTPERGIYHCFSSGKGGDIFTFVQEMEGVDFRGALTILAEKAGVELVREAPGAKDEREMLFAALADATKFFQQTLSDRTDVLQYLERRGITAGIVSEWSIGYAPREWGELKAHLLENGYNELILEKAGLIKSPDSTERPKDRVIRTYDRFRRRIMFPIFDVTGKVIAFSGRIFEDDPEHPQAKYLNSPETSVFDKSRALYGIHRARTGIRELHSAMLVEGQVDLLMAHAVGYRNAVATSGTAFTDSHAQLLKRYSPNLLIAYDGDGAGIQASGRAARVALRAGMNVKVATMPAGVDPADLILENSAAFKECVKSAEHIVDFTLAHTAREFKDQRALKLAVTKDVLPFVAEITNMIDQAHFIARIAEVLGVPVDAVQAELRKIQVPGAAQRTDAPTQSAALGERDMMMGIYLSYKDASAERATQVEKLFADVYGESIDSACSSLTAIDQEACRMFAEVHFFMLNTTDEEQDAVLNDMRQSADKKERNLAYRTKLKLLRSAEAAGDAEQIRTLTEELNFLAKSL